jgi:alpha-D-xyloside xylohydrolase
MGVFGQDGAAVEALRRQIPAGLNIGLSGIPWWTTDIGGFKGGDIDSPSFRELVVRWFQFGVFSPLCRLHGSRQPATISGAEDTGAPNELWSFGAEAYDILRRWLRLRERLAPGGQWLVAHAPLARIPAYVRDGGSLAPSGDISATSDGT